MSMVSEFPAARRLKLATQLKEQILSDIKPGEGLILPVFSASFTEPFIGLIGIIPWGLDYKTSEYRWRRAV